MVSVKQGNNTNVGKNQNNWNSYTFFKNVKLHNHFGKLAVSYEVKHVLFL